MRNEENGLWNPRLERDFLETTNATKYATVHCPNCDFRHEIYFKQSKKCPNCGTKLRSSTPQGRNSPVSNYTEKFALDLINELINNINGVKAKRDVVCEELGLTSRSGADIAIVSEGTTGRVHEVDEIELVFEVKMSLVWNWKPDEKGEPQLIADYDGHCGRGSIYRTDSILKAIGKGAIMRGNKLGKTIPYGILGNSPVPTSYLDKVDSAVNSGIVQKFVSLTPNPLVVDKSNKDDRDPKTSNGEGFIRIDSEKEFGDYIKYLLESDQVFIGQMVEKSKIGEIINKLDLNKKPEKIGEEFFQEITTTGGLNDEQGQ